MDHKWHGMDGLVAFMDYLQEKGIKHYALNHRGDDCVEISFAMVGFRVEVSFGTNDFFFSVFRGNEGPELDPAKLFQLIDENW